ncbi:MAG: dienelactone hydrolase family protein [Actinomycetota bacterium]
MDTQTAGRRLGLARRQSRTAAGLVMAVVLAGCSGGGSEATGPGGAGPGADVGGFAVGAFSETYVDTSRATAASDGVTASPARALVTTVYYPAQSAGEGAAPAVDRGPFPLVLFSHGGGTTGTSYSNLLSRVAERGYVVAAPNYLPAAGDPGSRPADARFVLSSLLAATAQSSHLLHGLVDEERVGAMGHSMGGGITLGYVFNSCCLDGRVRAAVLLASAHPSYPGEAFPAPGVPALVVHGDADSRASYAQGRQLFADLRPPKYMVTVHGGEHTPPFSGEMQRPDSRMVVEATVAFLDLHLKGEAGAAQRLRSTVADQPLVASLDEVPR